MTLKIKVSGEYAQLVTCQLDAGQSLFADATKFRWKTTNVALETRLSTKDGSDGAASKAGGGFLKAALSTAVDVGKRVLAGQSVAFQWFTPSSGSGLVALAGDEPGQLRVLELDGTKGWRSESRSFIGAESSVRFDIDFSGFNLGRRSKEGYIFEHFTGEGTIVVGGGGTLYDVNPTEYGGKIQVHAGSVVAFRDDVTFAVERVGALNAQTVMTAVFGGSGLNLVTLTGDGPVILQSSLHREFEAQLDQEQNVANPLRDGLLGRL